ncbi:ectomycorrhiza-regulated esterase [Gloeophyllum trabeum ATCC 11539]|uniref:Ectomycorrhiza-regulated esterase n=1 Tax=Gloeophyllum trabeum (strain ATCC 11539 / FP-39264 / Madison 617) TaxID=670483 RepID=S7Q441_GLOTA|nr:ectomycorrhiza-regulated esterase [Gloeophyllum trabeum ATCC 11539]EPQ54786.1 ectomycorrhiza-regulated esterase [Gloeophyllum trabeum ATCC 11539]
MAQSIPKKIHIPHTEVEGCSITGVLQQWQPDQPTQGKSIALILHGTMGHKDYLYQKRLAHRLPFDSFRFDFRGNHETPGIWRQGALGDDVVDLQVVVRYLVSTYGYKIDLVVGHSRGSIVAFHWLCTSEEGKTVTGFVNASGRYRMHKIYDNLLPIYKPAFESQGFYEWRVTVARKEVNAKIYPHDLEAFAHWDTSIVWDRFPLSTHALSVHGLNDKTVPPYDATIYARALGTRTPGTHNLYLMEDADHNFTGRQDDIVDTILEWWQLCERGDLKTGVWRTGVRGKL